MAELGTTSSPTALVPGDPAAVRGLAARLDVLGRGMSQAASRLAAIEAGAWVGEAGDAFRSVVGEQPRRLQTAGDAFGAAAAACRTYASVLEEAQADARRAVARWDDAEAASAAWRSARSEYAAAQQSAEVATGAAQEAAERRLAGLARPSAWDPGAADREAARTLLADARERVRAAGRSAAARLSAAGDAAPDEPGLLDKALHWGSEFVKGFGEAVWGIGEFAWTYSQVRMLLDPVGWARDVEALGEGLLYGVQHPVELGKALIDWDTWQESPARALGRLGPDLLLALATGGAGAAASRGASAATKVDDAARLANRADGLADVTGARHLDSLDDPLAAAARRDIDVGAITPTPVWRTSREPLFRLDNRDPATIFAEGFQPRGTDVDLVRFTQTNRESAFVSTSVADDLYRHPDWSGSRFQYEIDAPGGIDVNRTLDPAQNYFPHEAEIAFPGGISSSHIRGGWELVRDPAGGTPTRGQWYPNPDYVPRSGP